MRNGESPRRRRSIAGKGRSPNSWYFALHLQRTNPFPEVDCPRSSPIFPRWTVPDLPSPIFPRWTVPDLPLALFRCMCSLGFLAVSMIQMCVCEGRVLLGASFGLHLNRSARASRECESGDCALFIPLRWGGLYHGMNESRAKSGTTTFESRALAGVL